jgi:predicted Fe-Mo cluster-binding NifX family protein
MKVAVTAMGAGLGAWLDPDFIRCRQIVIVDDHDRFEAWENSTPDQSPADGRQLAQHLIAAEIGVLVTGVIPSQIEDALSRAGVKVRLAEKGSVLELVEEARKP